MHVYLDAVFNPLLYTDKRIFMQEGWHYELTAKDAPLEYKGVVYNEMKGAFSSAERELWYQIQKGLFPDNGYQFESGGYPSAIPTLTYEDFMNFHKNHYHPSNSYIFLYGDADMQAEMEFIDKEYLSKYDKTAVLNPVTEQKPFTVLKDVTAAYPVIEGGPVESQTYLSINWVIGRGSDPATTMALDILADVLVNQESAPIRKALQEAGIGKDIYATTQNLQQNTFDIVVQNANAVDKDSFKTVIMQTLKKVVEEKIDREALQGSLNRMEFRLREGNDAQKGLSYNIRAMVGWITTGNPFPALEYEPQLETLKEALNGTYLEDLVRKEMVENPFGLIVTLEPKPGLEKEHAAKIREELDAKRKTLTDAEVDTIIKNTEELIAFQKREDSPEAVATIPMLKLSDISPEAPWYEVTKEEKDGVPVLLHKEFTNDVVYMNFWFDMQVLPQEMIPYAAVLTELLGKMETGGLSYEQLDKALNINTGGFSSGLSVFLPEYRDDMMLSKLRVQMKTTPEKLDTSFRLLASILTSTKTGNQDRLGELLRRLQSQLEASVMQNGFGVARDRLESYFSKRGMFNDLTRGLDFYWFVTELVGKYEADPASTIAMLDKTREALFSKGNLIAGITCSEDDYAAYTKALPILLNNLKEAPVAIKAWDFTPEAKNEGILTASKVQYVLEGYDFNKLGLTWSGKWNVLSQIMSTDWLQTRIRVVGGAYGGFSGISRNGTLYLASYRDPNLKETLDNYMGTVDYLAGFQADSAAMTRYIIGTISNIDYLMTPSDKGELAFRRYFEKTTHEAVQKDRDEVLATSAADIRNMSGMIDKVLDQKVLCVYGNEDKVKSNKDLFRNLVKLQP
jgi:Zn-dependent M16 (insulinase) family peptidase